MSATAVRLGLLTDISRNSNPPPPIERNPAVHRLRFAAALAGI